MTRKRFSEEDILRILRQIELELASGVTVETAVQTACIYEFVNDAQLTGRRIISYYFSIK